jgi:hypothetical protein
LFSGRCHLAWFGYFDRKSDFLCIFHRNLRRSPATWQSR